MEKNSKIYNMIFNQLMLQNHIALSLAKYAEDCGMHNFIEAIDMNCGAVPEGDFNSIIDPESPEVFLKLYAHIVQDRLAFTITNMLKASTDFYEPIFNFVKQTGNNMQIEELQKPFQGYQIFNSVILDENFAGSSDEIITNDDDIFEWKRNLASVKASWEKSGGEIKNYFEFVESFCLGLFENSKINFKVLIDETFRICENSD